MKKEAYAIENEVRAFQADLTNYYFGKVKGKWLLKEHSATIGKLIQEVLDIRAEEYAREM